ncbi:MULTISPECIES: HIRAN domain-containing protein [Helcococcus]|uniref:HIRAN domain-containing protein n=1 Tax=Helcococcus bovis TaxID=3153252 RepID=A0ABW9F9I2_9FIRM
MKNEIQKHSINNIVKKTLSGKSELKEYKPFQKDIFLFDTYIAGTTHIENIDELEKEINIDNRLEFFRQEENTNDTNAIEIRNSKNIKIGYVPKVDNIIFSRLMDAGKLLYAIVTNKEYYGKWVKIYIDIYLSEL